MFCRANVGNQLIVGVWVGSQRPNHAFSSDPPSDASTLPNASSAEAPYSSLPPLEVSKLFNLPISGPAGVDRNSKQWTSNDKYIKR